MIPPEIGRVLLTGGREIGGLDAFARALAAGFAALGYPAEIVTPDSIAGRWGQLRDPSVLKILSTAAVFAAPFARRAICVAHGFPRPNAQGWMRTLGILGSLKLANHSPGCKLSAVSDYVAAHLRGVYGLRVDAVIRNPLRPIFLEPWDGDRRTDGARRYLTYAGRLLPAKNLHRLLPAMVRLLDEDTTLGICVIGDGPQRRELEASVAGDQRVEFTGNLEPAGLRARLRQTRVLVSGNEMEPFGIVYLEALSQGCAVAMPACGGGLEIAPELIGTQIHLLPLSFDPPALVEALRRANMAAARVVPMGAYGARGVAALYLAAAVDEGPAAP